MKTFRPFFLFLFLLLAGGPAVAQPPFGAGGFDDAEPELATSVELLADVTSVKPGTPFRLGMKFTMKDPWNIYWKYPGNTGLQTEVNWDLPEGFKAGPIQWPTPKHKFDEDLVNFFFGGEVLLVSEITPPAAIDAKELTFSAEGMWLECDKGTCIQGNGKGSVTLSVGNGAASPAAAAFAETAKKLPDAGEGWTFEAIQEKNKFALIANPPTPHKGNDQIPAALFYPGMGVETDSYVTWDHTDLGFWGKTEEGYVLFVDLADADTIKDKEFTGILKTPDNKPVWNGAPSMEVKAPLRQGTVSDIEFTSLSPAADAPKSFFGAAFFFFIGGLILNLMPCIFPILTIKVMGFVKQAQDGGTHAWKHGLAFAIGVVVSFWVLVAALLFMRTILPGIGWGGQLQSPIFMAAMVFLFLLMSLNLFGVFEFGTSLTSVGQDVQRKEGYTGSFMSGVLATIIATPCTGPFMGAALAYAFNQPWFACLALFTFLAVGMALPYVLLSSSPRLLKVVPKPGAWMETFKKIMGFLMMAVTAWAVWSLAGLMKSDDDLLTLLMLLVIASLGVWIYGKWGTPFKSRTTRWIARVVAAVLVGGAFWAQIYEPPPIGIEWEDWSEERVAEARAAGKPVFVDYTARWCNSCQVNKRVALKKRNVLKTFKEKGVVILRADWTQRDKEIKRGLAKLGRVGIPVYPLYVPGQDEPEILPQILSPGIVIDALEKLPDAEKKESVKSVKLPWEPWSQEREDAALEEGRSVFVNYTARWTAQNQIAKKTVFDKSEVLKAFQEKDVLLLEADWTQRDKEIKRGLAKLGRVGIPVYPLHTPGQDEPVMLPQVLTKQIVLDALADLPNPS